jgi:hypothetical protein
METSYEAIWRRPSIAPGLHLLPIGRAARTLLAYQQELLRFTMHRLDHDVELGRTLARSHGWLEAANAHQQWLAVAFDDYANEGRRLLQLTAALAMGATDDVAGNESANGMPEARRPDATNGGQRIGTSDVPSARHTAARAHVKREERAKDGQGSHARGTKKRRGRGARAHARKSAKAVRRMGAARTRA